MRKAIIVIMVLAICAAFAVGCSGLENLTVDDISVIVEENGYFTLMAYDTDGSLVGTLKHSKEGWEFIDQLGNEAYQKEVDGKIYSYLRTKGAESWEVTSKSISKEIIDELRVFLDPKAYKDNGDGTYTYLGKDGMPAEDVSTIKVEKKKITLYIGGVRYELTDIGKTTIDFPADLPPIE